MYTSQISGKTPSTNRVVPVKVTDDGYLMVATAQGVSTVTTTIAGYQASTTEPMYGFSVYNGTGSTIYVQRHDSATEPADTAVPQMSWVCSAAANLSAAYPTPLVPTNKWWIMTSSTNATLTKTGNTNNIEISYVA